MKKVWSLKTKFIVISTILTTSMIVVLVAFTTTVYLNGIKSLEIETIETNIDRGKSAYKYLVRSYNAKLNDWAQWDDTYQFMEDFNKQFISSNLNDATLTNLSTDEMLFFDTDLKLKYSIAADKILEMEEDFPKDVENFLFDNTQIVDDLKLNGESTGVIQTEDGTLLYSAQKIVRSDGGGDVRGYLVFGRYLDSWIEDDLSLLTQLPVKLDTETPLDDEYEIPNIMSNQNEKIHAHFSVPIQNNETPITFEI